MRIRTLKPEVALHEGLYELEKETGLPIRFAWVVFFCHCDREGRFKWEPRRLGALILPYDGIDFSRVLDAWWTRGFIQKYRVKDEWFGVIPTWNRHQVVNNREKPSEIPEVNEAEYVSRVDDASMTRAGRVRHASKEEGKGREGKGTEGNTAANQPAAVDSQGVVVFSEKRAKAPQIDFVEKWQLTYQAHTGEPYRATEKDYTLAAKMIRDHGMDSCVKKAVLFSALCDSASAWFTSDGWSSYTIGKLASHWNNITPEAKKLTPEEDLKAEIKKQEAMRERANALVK